MPNSFPWLAKSQPYPHQIAAGAWRRGRGLDRKLHPQCVFEMGLGTGKTLVTIEEILKLRDKQGSVRVLVLAPNAILRTVWQAQLREHSGGSLKVCVLDGTMAERRVLLRTFEADVFVHNHESIPAMHDALRRDDWDMVVIDEHSKFRTPGSARCKALNGVPPFKGSIRGKYKIALSGTPVIKRPSDLYTIYRWIGAPFNSDTSFRTQFSIMGGYGGHTELGARESAIPLLNHILDQHRFVVPKTKVLNIPRKPMTREVDLTYEQRLLYQKVQSQLKTEFLDPDSGDIEIAQVQNPLTELMRLAQVTAGFEAISKEKWTWLEDNAKAVELLGKSKKELDDDSLLGEILAEDGNCIVWCWYRPELKEYQRMLTARGVSSVTYVGGMKPQERVRAEADFNEGRAQVFLGQISAAGLGLNLPTARTMVYVTMSFDTEGVLQSLDRNSRMTTKHKELQVVYLEARNSVDQKIRRVVSDNIALSQQLSSLDVAEILEVKRK